MNTQVEIPVDEQYNDDDLVEIELDNIKDTERITVNHQNNKPKYLAPVVVALPFIWLFIFLIAIFVIPTFFANVIPLLTFLMTILLILFGTMMLTCICIFNGNKIIQFIGVTIIAISSVPLLWVYFSMVMYYKCYLS